MRFRALLAFFSICLSLKAADAPASDASIREILVAMDAKKLTENVFAQINQTLAPSMQQAIGRPFTPEEQQVVANLSSNLISSLQQELNWEKLEPLFIEVYRSNFTEAEIRDLVAFYRSPTGATLVKKMPGVMQQSMQIVQQRMIPIMQQAQQTIRDTTEGMKKSTK